MNSLNSDSSQPSLAVGANSSCSASTRSDTSRRQRSQRPYTEAVNRHAHQEATGYPLDDDCRAIGNEDVVARPPEKKGWHLQRVGPLPTLSRVQTEVVEMQMYR